MIISKILSLMAAALLAGCATRRQSSDRDYPPNRDVISPQEHVAASDSPNQNPSHGGRRATVSFSSLDAKATPFGSYDAAILASIQKRWYDLLDRSARASQGNVTIEFRLHFDGRVTDLKVIKDEVGNPLAAFCRRAILDPSPYAPWPRDMRRMLGKEYREVKLTFYHR